MIRTSLDKDGVLPHDAPVSLSPAFSAAAVSLSEQSQLAKPRPLIRPKNGLQPPAGSQPAFPAPRIGKRRFSVGVGFKGLAKRRRRANSDSQSDPVLPSHFLLGGNIFDPLNLNSLLDEDVNRVTNQETPKCSPLPSRGGDPVEILVPRDITDPLNLKGGGRDGADGGGVLLSPLKSRKRHRARHHGGGGGGGAGEKEAVPARLFPPTVSLLTREGSVPASPLPCELNTAITCRDDVAPPPILPRRHTHPAPSSTRKSASQGDGRHRRRRRTTSARSSDATATTVTVVAATKSTRFETPVVGGAKSGGELRHRSARLPQKKDRHRYQYGNHSRYYGYHGFYGDRWEGRIGMEDDPRLRLLDSDWFRGKRALDVGCGTGHITLAIARWFDPAHILGVELDERLVHAANRNILHFLSHDLVVTERGESSKKGEEQEAKGEEQQQGFPLSLRLSRGPLAAPPLLAAPPPPACKFPHNITFIQGDYVTQREAWPGQGQYDVILCLGVTKWVQLQLGDGGVARLFRRAYQSLAPGGLLVLEAQPWSSYSHSKRASETTFRQYCSLRLRPEQFTSFLTDNVGFTSYRLLKHAGNHRPVYLFHKGPAHRN
ncbi:unnamed protein product [Ophioblennius macclurei]